MRAKKNWFVYLALLLFECGMAYALYSGISALPNLTSNFYLRFGGAICVCAALVFLIRAAGLPVKKLRAAGRLQPDDPRARRAERVIVAAVLALSAALRVYAITQLPIQPSTDFLTYYRIAEMLTEGHLSASGYSGYIAEFPHIIGFPFILSLLFRITGPSVQAGLYLNMAFSLASVYLIYRIARTLSGRLAGLVALAAAAFWPSQILYGAILASEPSFTCLLLLCIWLFIYLFRYPAKTSTVEGAVFLCVILGALLALSNGVRPLASVLLIAIILCFIPCAVHFNKNEKMLNGRFTRAACQGWFRAALVLSIFLICNHFIGRAISNNIAYELPGSAASFGFNLMVGVNTESNGAWNQEDAAFFAEQFARTNSAKAAQEASLAVALRRIAENPMGVVRLGIQKYASLWGNDDYGAYWTTLFLSQQGALTPFLEGFIARITVLNNYIYLAALFFSAVCAAQLLLQKTVSPAQVLFLLFVGTAALHMLLESQNRYHYFMLQVFIILSSLGVAGLVSRKEKPAA
jgi:hypothetical protein